jgi:23S rRNA (uracil1939-C5)-methyltransferase
MSQEGRGIARREGKIVFVSGALAGEQVRVQCTAVKRDYDEAKMLDLVADTTPSAHRICPDCPVYEHCGGCSLQHWSLVAQQQHKHANLSALLQTITPLELDPPLTGRPLGFRHRLRLLVTRNPDRSYSLGLRQQRSHTAVSLTRCVVANDTVNRLLKNLPGVLLSVPDLQGLREIEIDADSDDHAGLCFYFAAHPGEKILNALRGAVLDDTVIALRVRLNAQRRPRGDARYDEPQLEDEADWQELHAEGELCLRLNIRPAGKVDVEQQLQLAYLPGDFTQTHWEINAALVARALAWLRPGGDEHALDLFCGIGNFSLPLARSAGLVHALEGDSSMTQRVVTNARRNGIENIKARTINLLAGEVTLPGADIAIVDPPRAGAKILCEALARSKVKRLVYVSCHPATLARDANVLHSAGFHLARAAVVDMFPHTGHSEAITLFERK